MKKRSIGAVETAAMLLAGILIGSRFHPSLLLCAVLFAAAVAGGVYFYRAGRIFELDQWQNKLSRGLICLAVLAAGMGRTAFIPQGYPEGSIADFIDRDRVSLTAHVIAPPVATASRTTLRVEAEKQENMPDAPQSGRLLLVFYRDPGYNFQYGDRLQISGKPVRPPDSGSGFSYRAYLERDGIPAMINNPSVTPLPGFSGDPLRSGIYKLRSSLIDRIYRLFPDPESALMAGILLGDESKITSDVDHAFQKTGTAHINANYLCFCL